MSTPQERLSLVKAAADALSKLPGVSRAYMDDCNQDYTGFNVDVELEQVSKGSIGCFFKVKDLRSIVAKSNAVLKSFGLRSMSIEPPKRIYDPHSRQFLGYHKAWLRFDVYTY